LVGRLRPVVPVEVFADEARSFCGSGRRGLGGIDDGREKGDFIALSSIELALFYGV
jgi:hypothetical protein